MPPAPFATSWASCALVAGVEHGRSGNGHQDQADVVLPDRAHAQPPEVPRVHGHVGPDLPTQDLGVELERRVLVVHPELCVGDSCHGFLLVQTPG